MRSGRGRRRQGAILRQRCSGQRHYRERHGRAEATNGGNTDSECTSAVHAASGYTDNPVPSSRTELCSAVPGQYRTLGTPAYVPGCTPHLCFQRPFPPLAQVQGSENNCSWEPSSGKPSNTLDNFEPWTLYTGMQKNTEETQVDWRPNWCVLPSTVLSLQSFVSLLF